MPPDRPRPVATSPDNDFTLSIDDAAQLYANAGHPRTNRTIQRYCASGHLECVKAATTLGDKYFISPQSVARHIAQINDLVAIENRATGLDMSRLVASHESHETRNDGSRHTATSSTAPSPSVAPSLSDDPVVPHSPEPARPTATTSEPMSRHDATGDTLTSRYVAQLEKEVDRLNDDRDFLRGQIKVKDEQISNLSTRFSETQRLVAGLQRMMAPLLGQADPYRGADQDPSSGDSHVAP